MFSLRNIAAHQLPEGSVTYEIVAKDIVRQTRKEIRDIDAQIRHEDKKYNKIFKHYSNILSPTCPIGNQYSKKWGEESFHAIMRDLTTRYKELYGTIPEQYDERSDWFEYLEYMNFRVFPSTVMWVYEQAQSQYDNLTMILLAKGVVQTIDEIPVPSDTVPTELVALHSVFLSYVKHLKNFIIFNEKRYSHHRVFKLHQKYVDIYENRSRVKGVLNKAKMFYNKITTNMYSSLYVPSILR